MGLKRIYVFFAYGNIAFAVFAIMSQYFMCLAFVIDTCCSTACFFIKA
jgi:hypothetical protein